MRGIFASLQSFWGTIKKRWQTPSSPAPSKRKGVPKGDVSKYRQIEISALLVLRRFLGVLSPRERQLWWGALAAAAASGLFLIVAAASGHIATRPGSGGNYSEAVIGEPHSLNPIFTPANDTERDLNRLLYAGLTKTSVGPASGTELELAQSIDVSSNGTTYTATLKPNTKWQDGEPLTAQDVVFTIQSIQNPDWKSALASQFRGVDAAATNDRTVTFHLAQPSPTFAAALSVGLLPQHLWKNVLPANARLAELNIKPIGAGPFRFFSIKKDRDGLIHSYTLERNPYYAGTAPYFDTVTIAFVDNATQAYQALHDGQVDGANHIGAPLHAQKNTGSHIQTVTLRLPQYTAVFFNDASNTVLSDPVVREALNRSVDKQSMVDSILGGDAEVIQGPLLPGMLGYDSSIPSIEFNTQKAEELLDTAGWKRLNDDEWKIFSAPKPTAKSKKKTIVAPAPAPAPTENSGSPLPYHRVKGSKVLKVTMTTVDQKELKAVADAIATTWRSIGIDATVNVVASDKFQSDVLNTRDYDALLYGQQLGSNQDPYPFWHSSQIKSPGLNLAHFSDKKVDQLLEQARQTSDLQKRAGVYQQFQKELIAQLPAIFLFRPISVYGISTAIHASVPDIVTRATDRWSTITQWYRKTKWSWK